MAEEDLQQEGLRARSEEAIADLANALIESPVFSNALSAALGAGERASQAQKAAMGAVGLPSADELARLERRLRSLSDRLEAVEDQLDQVGRDVGAMRRKITAEQAEQEVSTDQERLRVSDPD
jgi:chromosome segregation ATPase